MSFSGISDNVGFQFTQRDSEERHDVDLNLDFHSEGLPKDSLSANEEFDNESLSTSSSSLSGQNSPRELESGGKATATAVKTKSFFLRIFAPLKNFFANKQLAKQLENLQVQRAIPVGSDLGLEQLEKNQSQNPLGTARLVSEDEQYGQSEEQRLKHESDRVPNQSLVAQQVDEALSVDLIPVIGVEKAPKKSLLQRINEFFNGLKIGSKLIGFQESVNSFFSRKPESVTVLPPLKFKAPGVNAQVEKERAQAEAARTREFVLDIDKKHIEQLGVELSNCGLELVKTPETNHSKVKSLLNELKEIKKKIANSLRVRLISADLDGFTTLSNALDQVIVSKCGEIQWGLKLYEDNAPFLRDVLKAGINEVLAGSVTSSDLENSVKKTISRSKDFESSTANVNKYLSKLHELANKNLLDLDILGGLEDFALKNSVLEKFLSLSDLAGNVKLVKDIDENFKSAVIGKISDIISKEINAAETLDDVAEIAGRLDDDLDNFLSSVGFKLSLGERALILSTIREKCALHYKVGDAFRDSAFNGYDIDKMASVLISTDKILDAGLLRDENRIELINGITAFVLSEIDDAVTSEDVLAVVDGIKKSGLPEGVKLDILDAVKDRLDSKIIKSIEISKGIDGLANILKLIKDLLIKDLVYFSRLDEVMKVISEVIFININSANTIEDALKVVDGLKTLDLTTKEKELLLEIIEEGIAQKLPEFIVNPLSSSDVLEENVISQFGQFEGSLKQRDLFLTSDLLVESLRLIIENRNHFKQGIREAQLQKEKEQVEAELKIAKEEEIRIKAQLENEMLALQKLQEAQKALKAAKQQAIMAELLGQLTEIKKAVESVRQAANQLEDPNLKQELLAKTHAVIS
jgi:hypothetical protein